MLAPCIPESHGGVDGEAQPLDWLGAVLATTGLRGWPSIALSFAPEIRVAQIFAWLYRW